MITHDCLPRKRLVRPHLVEDKMRTDNDVVSVGSIGDKMELMGGDIEGIFDTDAPDDAAAKGEDLTIFCEERPEGVARDTADLVRAAQSTLAV